MSDLARSPRHPLSLALYAAAIAVIAFEAIVLWLMLHPNVSPDFRAYYIDRSTTCLNQPVTGQYQFGRLLDFDTDSKDLFKPIRVCGWEGPSGEGLHAVGTSSRLRFAGTPSPSDDHLVALMSAVSKDGAVMPQSVEVSIDGTHAATWTVADTAPERFVLAIPPDALADGKLEVEFDFPNAVKMGKTDPDTRWRSIKLHEIGVMSD